MEKLISILDAVAGGVTAQDKTGKLIYANLPAARIMGFDSVETLLATPIVEILQRFEVFDEQRQPFPFDQLPGRLALQGKEPAPMTLRFRVKTTGEERWSIVNAKPVFDPTNGQMAYVVNTFHDVTEMKQNEERSRILQEISARLSGSLTIQQIAQVVVDQVSTALDAHLGSVALVEGQNLNIIYSTGISDDILNRVQNASDDDFGVMGDAVRNRQPVWIENLEDYLRLYPQFKDLIRSQASGALPLIADSQVIGVMGLSFKMAHRFSAEERQFLLTLAAQCAQAIKRAQLHQETRANAIQLQLITDGIPALVSYIDTAQCYRFANHTYERWFGRPRNDIYGKTIAEVVGAEAYTVIAPHVEQVLYGEMSRFEAWVNYADAGRRYIDAAYIPDFDEHKNVRGFFVLVNDMTERKQSEQRALKLRQLTISLSQSLTMQEVGEVIIREGLAVMGSDTGAIYMLEGDMLNLIDGKNMSEQDRETYSLVPMTTPCPLTEAIRQQQAVFIDSAQDYIQRYPHLEQVVLDAGIEASVCLPFKVNARVVGGISAGFYGKRSFNDEERALYMAVAQQCGQALERAYLYEAQRVAREEAEKAHQRFEYLAQASASLASSLDYETTLTNIAKLAVPTIADWCAVDLLTNDHELQRLAVSHIDSEKVKWAYEIYRKYPPDLNAAHGIAQVLRSGEPVFYPQISEELLLLSAAGDQERLQMLREVGFRSTMIVPIMTRGKIFGALTLVSTNDSGRDFTPDDLALAQELGHRAGTAAENARLHRDTQIERERLQVTLTSIGDGVIVTDNQGCVRFLNPIAQQLTGWSQEEADGQPLLKVFNIINEYTRELVESPVDKVLREGVIVGLANHTLLINKQGHEISIDDSGAPIRDHQGHLVGVVLVFRDISEQREIERQKEEVLEQERRARVQVEHLAQASALLATSLDYQTTLTNIAKLAVPTIADWCAVDLLTDEGNVQRLAVTHVDPEKVKWAYEYMRKYPIDLNAPQGVARVLRSGKSDYYPQIPEEFLVTVAAGDQERLEMLHTLGLRSMIIVPIVARGKIFGVMTLVTTADTQRSLTEHDLALAEELGRRAGIAIENARLYRDAHVERERLQVTLTSIGDGVIVTDNEGRVRFLNPIAQQLTGWSQDEANDQPLVKVFNIINEYTRELVESPVDKVLREGVIVGLANHTLLINKQGHEISIDDSGAPIHDHQGRLVGVVLVFRDISERREIERQKEEVLEQERQARLEAEKADQLKLRFLGMISHELRTPLASIKGFATTLLATDVSFQLDEQRYFIGIMNDEADRLRNLIEQLLDLSSLEAGTLSIAPEPQTINNILEHALAQLVILTGDHSLTLNIPDALPQINADPQRIAQVLVNLVGNAAKYTSSGTPIIVDVVREGDFIRVDVTDTGPGIPHELRPYVFEAFRRVEDKTLRLKGAGLGLAISKGLIENHNGHIWIDEEHTGGTKMSFTLPVISS